MALIEGEALLWIGESAESIEKVPMPVGTGFAVAPGVVHRVEAVRDSLIAEISSPEEGTNVRLEDDYKRSDEKFS